MAVMTDPEDCFRERHVREWLAINITGVHSREKRHGASEFWTTRWMSPKIIPRELHHVHLTVRHVMTCLTGLQKHVTKSTGERITKISNFSSDAERLDCNLLMRKISVHP